MKILIVSYEAWRDTNNGGNVLSNIFSAFDKDDIAQIYCSGELPSNSICSKYFQLSSSMLLSSQKGKKLKEEIYQNSDSSQADLLENSVKRKMPSFFRETALFMRELLWDIVNWKTPELTSFVEEFNPDIIFAPCYSYSHVSKLALHVQKILGCPMISYISDDNYSLKCVSFSPLFWIGRLKTRKWIRRHFEKCQLIYTMTDLQKDEYEKIFGVPMKVLCKAASFDKEDKSTVNTPVKLIYGGGLYLNRWKVLSELSSVLRRINSEKVIAQLHIYSNTKLKSRTAKLLNDGYNSFLHSAIPFSELEKEYQNSDIAIHVESFDLRNRLLTRLSFSTKIIDCMNSGCAVLAIGPQTQAGIKYLKDNNAALCINEMECIDDEIANLLSNTEKIIFYSKQAKILGKRNHKKEKIDSMVRTDFSSVIETFHSESLL